MNEKKFDTFIQRLNIYLILMKVYGVKLVTKTTSFFSCLDIFMLHLNVCLHLCGKNLHKSLDKSFFLLVQLVFQPSHRRTKPIGSPFRL